MKLSKLGEYIELINETNNSLTFGPNHVVGITISKTIIPTKADTTLTELSKFIVVRPNDFIYNPRTHGKKIGLGLNDTTNTYITSWNNTGFRIKEEMKGELIPEYLYMLLCREEWDRWATKNSWGSSTEVFSWNSMCEMELSIPPISIQQKFVNVYKALVANQKAYENGLDDLKTTCESYIENLRKTLPVESIGKYIEQVNRKNVYREITNIKGVSAGEGFIETKANMTDIDLANYKIVYEGDFAFTPTRINIGSIDLYYGAPCVISPFYVVFRTKSPILNPQYLLMWLRRDEFYRYTLFKSDGNIRQTFDFASLCDVVIPIPEDKIQKSIIEVYLAYEKRQKIHNKIKQQISDICPILIKGSIEEAQRG